MQKREPAQVTEKQS